MKDENIEKVQEIEIIIGDGISPDKLNVLGKVLQKTSHDGLAMIIIVGGPTKQMNEVVICGPADTHQRAASVLEFLAARMREGLPDRERVSPHAGN